MSSEVAGIGERSGRRRVRKSKNGFLRLASIRALISVWVAWGWFCELVGIEMEVGEWSERENEVHSVRSKTRAQGDVFGSNSNNYTYGDRLQMD